MLIERNPKPEPYSSDDPLARQLAAYIWVAHTKIRWYQQTGSGLEEALEALRLMDAGLPWPGPEEVERAFEAARKRANTNGGG